MTVYQNTIITGAFVMMAREDFLSFLQLDRNEFPMSHYMRQLVPEAIDSRSSSCD